MQVYEGEALALLYALRWVQHIGMHNVAFLSDSQILVDIIYTGT